jgi:hypothetical protein
MVASGAMLLPCLAVVAAAAVAPSLRTFDVVADRGRVFAGRTDGLAILDLADPLRPKSVARLSVRTAVLGLAVSGDRVALAAGRLGCVLVEAKDPEKLAVAGTWNETGSVVHVALSGSVVFLAEGSDGLRVVDFADPQRPRGLATVSTRGRVRRLARSGDLLATAEVDGGVRVFDVAHPGSPRELRAIATEDALDVAWAGDHLLVALGSAGLGVLAPGATRLAVQPASGPALAVTVDGLRAAVSGGLEGLRLFDLTDVLHPRPLGRLRLPQGLPAGVAAFAGDRLYVAADTGAVAVVDVGDPEAPRALAPAARKLSVGFAP